MSRNPWTDQTHIEPVDGVRNLGAGDRLGLGLVGSETLKNVVDLELKPGRTERERSNTVGLEVIVDLEAAPATVYDLGLRRRIGGSEGFPLLQCHRDRTRSHVVCTPDELRFPCYL
jgi:hypothetical protein